MKEQLMELMTSTEAINFQYGGTAHAALTQAFVTLRDLQDFTDQGLRTAGFEKIIKDFSKMNVKVAMVAGLYGATKVDCYIQLPGMKAMHSFVPPKFRDFSTASDGVRAIRLAGDFLNAGVDLKKGTVSGGFSTIQSTLFMTKAFVNSALTPEQQAAIFLHECGHPFTYFEFFAETTRTNYALLALSQSYSTVVDRTSRMVLVKAIEDTLDIKLKEPKELAAANDGPERQLIVVTAVTDRIRSELASSVYDARATEFLADQYAIRMGAGRYLAEAIVAMEKLAGSNAVVSNRATMVASISAACILVIGGAFVAPMVTVAAALSGLLLDPRPERQRDDPLERLQAVERELIAALKSAELEKSYVLELLEDIKIVQEAIKKVGPAEHLVLRWIGIFNKNARNNRRIEQFQQDLEKLAYNKIEASARKLLLQAEGFA